MLEVTGLKRKKKEIKQRTPFSGGCQPEVCVHPLSPRDIQSLTLASVCAEYPDRAGNSTPLKKDELLPPLLRCCSGSRLQKLNQQLCRTRPPRASFSPASWPERQHDTFLSLVISSLAHTSARTDIFDCWIRLHVPLLVGNEGCLSSPALTKIFPPALLFFHAR